MPSTLDYLFIYLVAINLFVFILCGYDKTASQRKGARRIRERTFFILSFLGASPMMLCGMSLFRHKTKHNTFRYGVPIIFVLQLLLVILYLQKQLIVNFSFLHM